MEYLGRFLGNSHIGQLEPSILIVVILDRHSRLNTSDLQARLKTLDLPGGIFNTEQVTEFVDQMQVYEGAMYEISTKLEILDAEFQVRFSHDPIHHMERRLKSVNSIIGKLERKGLPLSVSSIKDNLFDVAGIRVICNYRDDVYSVSNYLSSQSDIQVLITSRIQSRTDTVRCMSSMRCRYSCLQARITRRSKCSSAPSPWITGHRWNMRCDTKPTCRTPN